MAERTEAQFFAQVCSLWMVTRGAISHRACSIMPAMLDVERDAGAVPRARVPMRVWGGLALAVTLDTLVQIIWKSTVRRVPGEVGSIGVFWSLAKQPALYLVIALATGQFINWMLLLSVADVSFALPFTALGYVSVGLFSVVLLGEHVGMGRAAGIALILAGVGFISRTPHSTRPAEAAGARLDCDRAVPAALAEARS